MFETLKALCNVRDFAKSMAANADREWVRLNSLIMSGNSQAVTMRDEAKAASRHYKIMADYAQSEIVRVQQLINDDIRKAGFTGELH